MPVQVVLRDPRAYSNASAFSLAVAENTQPSPSSSPNNNHSSSSSPPPPTPTPYSRVSFLSASVSASHRSNGHPNMSPRSRSGILRMRRTEDLVRRAETRLASNDISASSRLSGYLFIFTSYCVLFVSSIKYQQPNEGFDRINNVTMEAEMIMKMRLAEFEDGLPTADDYDDIDELQNLLQLTDWKMKCTIYGSAVFIGFIFIILSMHFDKYCFPSLWRVIFKTGSLGECTILSVLMLFSIFMLYVSTSTTGLGGYAGAKYNVYFSSWLGCIASAHTFDLWRLASGKPSIGDVLKKDYSNDDGGGGDGDGDGGGGCRTNYNWSWTFLFSFITLLSLLDTFLANENGVEKLMDPTNLTMVISSSVSSFCCILAIVMNTWSCCCKGTWRYRTEGLMLVLMCSFWSFVVFRFTGINGIVNGPSNSYFGVWGSFFFSISTFGVWVKDYRRAR